MENKDSNLKIQRSPDADATLAGDRAAIYHRATGKAITLNPVGTILWQVLEQPQTRGNLVKVICDRWPQVDEATVAADVDKFLEQLREHTLIETA